MQKNIFHNYKHTDEIFEEKKLSNLVKKNERQVVDINKLLNRVKINKHNEIKKQILFFSLAIFLLIVIGIFISIMK